MPMDSDVKEYLDLNFKNLAEKIESYNTSHTKDILRLQHNDEEHYSLDRTHRETCANNREAMKEEMDASLSRFGERIGTVEGLNIEQNTKIGAIESTLSDNKNNLQEWLRTLMPYFILIGGLIYLATKGV